MSITVTMKRGERVLSRYGMSQSMEDVLRYLNGWAAPMPINGDVTAEITQSNGESRCYALRVNGRNVTLVPR